MVDLAQAHVPFLFRHGVGSGSPQRELDGLIASDPFYFSSSVRESALMSHANPVALSDNPFPRAFAVNAFNQ